MNFQVSFCKKPHAANLTGVRVNAQMFLIAVDRIIGLAPAEPPTKVAEITLHRFRPHLLVNDADVKRQGVLTAQRLPALVATVALLVKAHVLLQVLRDCKPLRADGARETTLAVHANSVEHEVSLLRRQKVAKIAPENRT